MRVSPPCVASGLIVDLSSVSYGFMCPVRSPEAAGGP